MPRTTTLLVVSLLTVACAHHHGGAHERGIRVTATGRAGTAPDQASITLGIVTEAPTAAAAAGENARKQAAILAAVKPILPAKSMVQTQGYNVSPSYAGGADGSRPRITAYTVRNSVHIRFNDVALVGKVIDLAIAAGANEVQGVSFEIQDPTPLRTRALDAAARNARSEAEAIARSLGLTVTGIRLVEIGQTSNVIPFEKSMAFARVASDAAPTPIESGEVEASAQVTVTFETSR